MREIILILDNVRSVLNVGAILRTSDAVQIKEVILYGITPGVNHKKISKTALGAEEFVNVTGIKDFSNFKLKIFNLKSSGFEIISIEQTENSSNFFEYNFKENGKYALIFGNEISGVSPDMIDISDKTLQLPMLGKKNSLNIASTLAITTFWIRYAK